MATSELLQLIDLSLGGEPPCGVVNFNSMHTLLHEIVRRLLQLEGFVISNSAVPAEGGATGYFYQPHGSTVEPTVMISKSTSASPAQRSSIAVGTSKQQPNVVSSKQVDSRSTQVADTTPAETAATVAAATTKQISTEPETVSDGADKRDSRMTKGEEHVMLTTTDEAVAKKQSSTVVQDVTAEASKEAVDFDETAKTVHELGAQLSGEVPGQTSPIGTSMSHLSMRHPSAASSVGAYHTSISRSRPHMISASNELAAMERKIAELENRLGTFEALPDLLERKGANATATPVKDLWNFTSLNKRVDAAEDGIHQTSSLVDEVLGQLRDVMEQLSKLNQTVSTNANNLNDRVNSVTGKVETLEEQLNALRENFNEQFEQLKQKMSVLEGAALAPGDDRVPGLLSELQQKIDKHEVDIDTLKGDMKLYVKWTDLDQALNAYRKSSSPPPPPETHPSPEAVEALQKVGELANQLEGFMNEYKQLQDELANKADFNSFHEELAKKVNISDLSSLIPQEADDGSKGLLPLVIELQAKLTSIENDLKRQPSLPTDVMENINSMQSTVEQLLADMSLLSSQLSTGTNSRLEELGSQVAQVRERLADMDQALTATANALRSQQQVAVAVDSTAAVPAIDSEVFNSLQSMVNELQQQQERLLDTAANISHELGVNQDHVKALYSGVDELRKKKADKDQVQVEVDEKADRDALDAKASKQWVDSTFVRLDKEIREARSKLEGQEMALKSAVDQLASDVDAKVDRMEIERIESYLDQKIRARTAPTVIEKPAEVTEDAAGFKRRLKAKCISCDKPVGILPTPVIPNLPSGATLPGVRSFRPYTTYELELVRQHQRL